MPLSAEVKEQFARFHGYTIEEASQLVNQTRPAITKAGGASQVSGPSKHGRGYVHMGVGVSAAEKDKENMDLLKFW